MSAAGNKNNKDDTPNICANCGKGDEGSLKACMACKMVKYCNRECQIAHRPQHKKECKKRAAELHDEKLFKQPPLQFDDCPICFLRMPVIDTGRRYYTCCGKTICSGCVHAPVYDDKGNEVTEKSCPFCRTPNPTTNKEAVNRTTKRVDCGDAMAIYDMGCMYKDGCGCPQNDAKALELWHRAAELGGAAAYFNIGCAYDAGDGAEIDKKKAKHYYELAAMQGSVKARYNLGFYEAKAGNNDRALKHWMIAAGDGDKMSLKEIKKLYLYGNAAAKEDYSSALESYQVYLDEIKSDQRDKAAAADVNYKYID